MNAMNLNLKTIASAMAALALTTILSWTFVDATSVARVQRDASASFLTTLSALVR